ncbi:hypothetical protein JCM19992_31890 [Thermostilla marina]
MTVQQIDEPLYSTYGDDPDLGELVEMFVEEMPDRMRTLNEYYEAKDWEELRKVTHQLKGAAGSYGFEPITFAAAALEDCLRRAPSEENVSALFESLIDLCRRARAGAPK